MVNANGAELTDLFTSATGGKDEDDTPNAVGAVRQPGFDLVIEAEAGSVTGPTGAPYTLRLGVMNLTQGVPAPSLRPQVGWLITGNVATRLEHFGDAVDGWDPGQTRKRSSAAITVATSVQPGDVFIFTLSLIAQGNQIISSRRSNEFVLL
jgi:hypothetical protein